MRTAVRVAPIPFADVRAAYREIGPQVRAAIEGIFESGAFVQGRWVEQLETAFAEHIECSHAVAVSSGTDALVLALRALHLRPGDEVLVPAFTFFASAEAIVLAGGVPVFVDVDPRTLQIDVEAAASLVGPRTVGVLAVHLYGAPCDLHGLARLCDRHDLWLIEDAAQAHGARLDGRAVGSFGDAACFSFYPGKNLGTCGEGGLVASGRADVAERVRLLRDHGAREKYHHECVGTNARMSEIEAAVLALKLPHLERWNRARRSVAKQYVRELAGLDLGGPELQGARAGQSVHHLFVVRHVRRDALRDHLASDGIATGLHYPLPLHLQPALAEFSTGAGSRPNAEDAARTVLSLPMFPELSADEVTRVARSIQAFGRVEEDS